MKNDLPRFMMLAVQFIDPLYNSFYYMQYVFRAFHVLIDLLMSLLDFRLNIFYMILEKVQGFAQGKYDLNVTTPQIGQEYEEKRSDAWERIDNMSITKRIVSTCAFACPVFSVRVV